MSYQSMNLDELARHIGMDAREVRRMAEKGQLPGQMVGGAWRFHRAQLLDWLQREMHSLDREHVLNLERATSQGMVETIIGSLLPTEGVDMKLPARSRTSVLRELVRLVEHTGLLFDRDGLVDALLERERSGSTALKGGLAFPHPRRPLPYATAEPLVCIARVPAGIPFGAPDGGLTDLFVLVCSHDDREHLHVLARLALLFEGDLAERLRCTDDNSDALQIVLEAERQVLAARAASAKPRR